MGLQPGPLLVVVALDRQQERRQVAGQQARSKARPLVRRQRREHPLVVDDPVREPGTRVVRSFERARTPPAVIGQRENASVRHVTGSEQPERGVLPGRLTFVRQREPGRARNQEPAEDRGGAPAVPVCHASGHHGRAVPPNGEQPGQRTGEQPLPWWQVQEVAPLRVLCTESPYRCGVGARRVEHTHPPVAPGRVVDHRSQPLLDEDDEDLEPPLGLVAHRVDRRPDVGLAPPRLDDDADLRRAGAYPSRQTTRPPARAVTQRGAHGFASCRTRPGQSVRPGRVRRRVAGGLSPCWPGPRSS